ncbi:hypothetical protein HDC90_005163 [Pedobacter sp. AK013]|nr:hypothetical protein [Pedobacter sp. AK013]
MSTKTNGQTKSFPNNFFRLLIYRLFEMHILLSLYYSISQKDKRIIQQGI